MAGAAVAGWVRGKALLQRRVGLDGARRLATAGSLEAAVRELSATPYGHDVRVGMNLPAAQRAVQAALLWNLRILAGWADADSSDAVRLLAGGFEIVNTVDRLVLLAGGSPMPPFRLGSLSSSWGAVEAARTAADVRSALARSDWRDPGAEDPGSVLLVMRLAWARRVYDEVAPALPWARDAARLMAGHLRSLGAEGTLPSAVRRDLLHVLGRPPEGVGHPPGAPGWADWWRRVEDSATALAAGGRAGPAPTVGVVGLLAADARRVGSALGAAGTPAGDFYRTGHPDALA